MIDRTGWITLPDEKSISAFFIAGGPGLLLAVLAFIYASDFLADFLRFVIDEMVRAKLFALLQLHVTAGSGNHARAEELGNLNCSAAHAASGAEN